MAVSNSKPNKCFRSSVSKCVCFVVLTVLNLVIIPGTIGENVDRKDPTVLIVFLARNKAHTLPYFLTLMDRLEYPKHRISLWIRSDHNEDKTAEILNKWLLTVDGLYHSINSNILSSPPELLPGQNGPTHWSMSRFTHVMELREEALIAARNMWADYIWYLDCDAFIINPNTLKQLMLNNHTVSAPMLQSDGMYSNFWCGMTDNFYYQRTEDYSPTLYRKRVGCFAVPMVHSAVLIDLRTKASNDLTFINTKLEDYVGPHDDIIVFAISANKTDITLYVCNDHVYGFIMVPLSDTDALKQDLAQLTNIKLQVLVENPPLPISELFSEYISYPERDTLGFDRIYMINLLRRPDRRLRMAECFKELGIMSTTVDAVDGRLLNESALREWDIHTMPDYVDPYHKRPITMGEIGCFLSHYNIWKEVVEKGFTEVMVLEDDIQFEPFFRQRIGQVMEEMRQLNIDWDLVYLGRKRLEDKEESYVPGSKRLVNVGYSYWTLGYLLSERGAHKLLAAKPLENLLPVDEYLPILFDKHPEVNWKAHFPERNLVALSAAPLLVFPTHYTGEIGYVSDTEDSKVVDPPSTTPRDDL